MKKILLTAGVAVVLLGVWTIVLTSGAQREYQQRTRMEEASAYLQDKVFVKAVPLLREAVAIEGGQKEEAYEALAACYLGLEDRNAYLAVLEEMTRQEFAGESVYRRLADAYLETYGDSDFKYAMKVLLKGMEKTNSQGLQEYYEQTRYAINQSFSFFEETGLYSEGYYPVRIEGKWGYANPSGEIQIKPVYEKATAFENGLALVLDNGQAAIIDTGGRRCTLFHGNAQDVSGFAGGFGAIRQQDGWHLVNGEAAIGKTAYESVGAYSGGLCAVQSGGAWILRDVDNNTLISGSEGFSADSVGRVYAMERIFVKKGSDYALCDKSGKEITPERYQDARPFVDGYAAVKKDGVWGFVSQDGVLVIPPAYEDALSFSQGLAPVKQDGVWGYITTQGATALPFRYAQAGQFSGGTAAVNVDGSWFLLRLKEYL